MPRDVKKIYKLNISYDWNINDLKNRIKNVGGMLLSTTEGCNLRCKYCTYSEKYKNDDKKIKKLKNMDINTAKRAILNIKNLNPYSVFYVGFYGGECLQRIDFIKQCVSYVRSISHDESLSFGLTTNGLLLNEENRNYLRENDFNVTVSLDGPEIIHDRYRVYGEEKSYAKIIEFLKAWKNEAPNYFNMHVSINSVLALPVIPYIIDDFFNDIKIEMSYSNLNMTSQFEEFLKLKKNDNLNDVLVSKQTDIKNYYNLYKKYIESELKEIHNPEDYVIKNFIPGGSCIPGGMKIYVDVDGNYYPCEKTDESMKYCIGNVDNGIDYQRAMNLYNDFVEHTKQKCVNCWAVRKCKICIKDTGREINCARIKDQKRQDMIYYLENINDDVNMKKILNS